MVAVFAWVPGDDSVRRLTEDGYRYPCIHPDGTHVVCGGGEGPSRVWRVPTDGSLTTAPLTPEGMFADVPTYTFDGTRMVFSGSEQGTDSLFTGSTSVFAMRPDGGGLTRLTEGPHRDIRPSLSPDGTTVAFFSDRPVDSEPTMLRLWLADAAGRRDPWLLVDEPVGRPVWSRDGTTIYGFNVLPDGCRAAAITVPDGTLTLLPNDPGHTHGLFHARDRDVLIAHSTMGRRDMMNLWELPLDGSQPTPIVPPGIDGEAYAHGTLSDDGILTFDHTPGLRDASETLSPHLTPPTACWQGFASGRAAA